MVVYPTPIVPKILLKDPLGEFQTMAEVVDETKQYLTDFKDGLINPLRNGTKAIKNIFKGLYEADIMVVAARTGMGKTTKMVYEVKEYCNTKINGIFEGKLLIVWNTWEMSSRELVLKQLAAEAGFNVMYYQDPDAKLTDDQLEDALGILGGLKGMPIIFFQIPSTVRGFVDRQERIAKMYPGARIVTIVDHSRLAKTTALEKSEEQKITRLMNEGFFTVKKQLKHNCILISQMNRNYETSVAREDIGSRLPIVSDIFGSDGVAQGADVLKVFHRPGYYGYTEWQYAKGIMIPTGRSDLDRMKPDNLWIEMFLKNRNGDIAAAYCEHEIAKCKFRSFKLDQYLK